MLIGNVPIRLSAPIPWFDDAGGGGDGDPGPPGMPGIRGTNGATGAVGPLGPAIFMAADEGQDGDSGPVGAAGTAGAAGITGPAGPTGPAGTTLVYVNTTVPAGNTVANTSSETFFTSAYSIPASTMTIGMVLRVKLFGVYSTGIVAPSLALKIYFGTTVMVASGTLTTVAGVTNDGWSAEGLFVVQTIGSSGTIEAQGLSEFSTASTAVLFVNMDNTAPVTVNTLITETIQASVQWGGTVNASDTITLREMTVEVITVAGIPLATATIGPTLMFFGDEGDEGLMGPPGVSPKSVISKGANWISTSGAIIAASAGLVFVNCPLAGVIKKVKIVTAGGAGSCVIDIWKAPFASFPPTVANTITAAALPTISAGVTYQDSVLTGWTTSVNAGDVLAFKLNSSSTFTQILITVEVNL